MIRRIFLLLFFFSILINPDTNAQQQSLQAISTTDLRAYLEVLASDSMAGRSFLTEEPGLENAADYLKKQAETLGLKSAAEGYFQNFKVEREGGNSFPTKNIIGFIEGGDPLLKNEFVVYMAHYDHLGKTQEGEIYNGADDNGSGTVALLEIADAFLSLAEKPKRSIVFLWVAAEEVGLFGSAYYAENPVFPLNQTVTCINLDMIGRVREQGDTIWQESPKFVKDFDGIFTLTSDFFPELETVTDSLAGKLGLVPDKSLPDRFLRSSDHYHFHRNGVPILNLATGYHADYHEPTDEISKINFDKLKRVAELAFLVGYEISSKKIQPNE